MMANDGSWTPNQRQKFLIERLARTPVPTLAGAARELGIPIPTAERWNVIPGFLAAVDEKRREKDREITSALLARIAAACDEALTVLIEIMRDKRASPYVRLQAVQDLLDRYLGKATQRQEISGKDGGAIQVRS